MKKSELKEIIKAEFLSEKEDSKKGNKEEQKRMEGAIRDDRDHIKDLEKDIKDNEEKLAKLKKDEPKDVSEEMKKDDVDEAMRGGDDDIDEMMRGGSTYEEDDTMREAEDVDVDVDEKEDINVDVEDDIDIDDVSKESDIEVKSELPGESADVSAILGLLTKAQDKAEGMGDEKLMDQIGNTITYYTRTHVVAEDARTDAEEEGYKDGMKDEKEDMKKEELNEEFARFKKLAGLI
tara:strand:+ start:56 stop:760 length:705 start_codon:yes stop_codon:yes gene_type:complete